MWILLGCWLFLVGAGCSWVSTIPYLSVKAYLDSWMSDGNLQIFTLLNYPVFVWGLRFLACLAWALIPVVVFWRRKAWTETCQFIHNLVEDGRLFWQDLKTKVEKPWVWLTLSWITLLAAIFRMRLLQAPMRHDESYTYAAFASGSLWSTMTDYHLPNNHVFHSLLVNLATHLLGKQPWVVRLPAFISGLLLIFVVYAVAARLYNPEIALVSSALVASSPDLAYYSTNARGYTMLALIWMLTLLLGLYVLQHKNRFAWGGISVLAALGFYTVPVMLFPYGVLCTWLFLSALSGFSTGSYRSRWDFLRYLVVSGIGAIFLTLVLYLPVMIYSGPAKLFENNFIAPLSWKDFPATLWDRLKETWQGWNMGYPLIFTALLVVGFAAALILRKKMSRPHFSIPIAAFIWIGLVLAVRRPQAWEKIWVFLIPIFLIWSTAGVMGLLGFARQAILIQKRFPDLSLSRQGLHLSTLVMVGGLAFITLKAVQVLPALPARWAAKGEVEQAAIYLKSQVQDQDKLIITSANGAPLWYYFKLYGIPDWHLRKDLVFKRAIVIVDLKYGQTLEQVLADPISGGPYTLDCGAHEPFHQVGSLLMYLCNAP